MLYTSKSVKNYAYLVIVAVGLILPGCTSPSGPEPAAPSPTPAPPTSTTAPVEPTATLPSTITPTPTALIATETPALATATAEPEQACVIQQPFGWVNYQIRRGDTLFRLAQRGGVSVDEIKRANCLISDDILAGGFLFVPAAAASQPPTPVPPPLPTDTPCSAYGCDTGLLNVPTGSQLAITLGWLGLGLTLGFLVVWGRPQWFNGRKPRP